MLKRSVVLVCSLALSLAATSAFAQTDAALTASVKTKLAADSAVKASDITVATSDHVVTLTGTVPDKTVKERALAIARGTKGVTSVVDKLTISGMPDKTAADKAAGGVEKGADKGAEAVGTAAHKSAGAVDKSKEAVGTAANKTGEALGTAAKKTGEAIGTAAGATAKAVGVGADKTKEATKTAAEKTKEKTGTAGSATADAAITAAVKSKLLGDGKTPGLKLDVDTDDGVVTLEGEVANASQRTEALRLARETKGVRRVVDKMTIAK